MSETIDINSDGEYTERSTGIYNAVCNRSLRFMADHLERPELLDPVCQNLDMMAHLFHDDGTIVTSISNRQDRGRKVVPISAADSYFDMAQRDGNGMWASIADQLVACSEKNRSLHWLIQPFLSNPQYRNETLSRQSPPDKFSRVFPVSGLWRVKRGLLSATAATGNTVAFSLQYGEVQLKALKISGTYLGKTNFQADTLTQVASGIHMVHDGAKRAKPGYDLPLGQPVPLGTFSKVKSKRERWTLPALSMTLAIHEVKNGFDLQLRTEGGLDLVTFQIECCFQGPGEWETQDQVSRVENGQTSILKRDFGIFHRDRHAISIGPGAINHRMWQMRGTEPEPDSFRVLVTLLTPVEQIFKIRYGLWSPAQNELLEV